MLLVEPESAQQAKPRGVPIRRKMDKKQQIYGLAHPQLHQAQAQAQAQPRGGTEFTDMESEMEMEKPLPQTHRVLFAASREELESSEDENAHALVIPKAVLVHQPNV